MDPTPANLMALLNKRLTLDTALFQGNHDGLIVAGSAAGLEVAGDAVKIGKGGAGHWIPYVESRAVIGYPAPATWVASGPFSGCTFSIGKTADGRVYAAHIARQSGSTGPDDFAALRTSAGLQPWYENAIPLPSQEFYSGSYMFAKFGSGGITSLARVDVNVSPRMGGSDGTIFNVHVFK